MNFIKSALKIEAVQMILSAIGMFAFTIIACLVGIPA